MSEPRVPAEELDELRAAISSLRDEIEGRWLGGRSRSAEQPAAPGPANEASSEPGASAREVDWMGLFGELRRRFSVFGVEPSESDVDDFGLDAGYLAQWRGLLDFLHDRWWRIETAGTERIPSGERVLYVANRSGILPYDGLMIAHAVDRARGREARPRFLVADWLLGVPFAAQVLARLGGVRACAENAERLLRTDRSVLAFPEGQKGALKLYRDRYQLQRFARGGFVSIALRQRATIVPVAVVGAEGRGAPDPVPVELRRALPRPAASGYADVPVARPARPRAVAEPLAHPLRPADPLRRRAARTRRGSAVRESHA